MTENLTKKTFKGIQWNLIATVFTSVMQLVYTGVMARLLEPADFGLVAIANLVLRFGSYFSQMGMSQALIQKKKLHKTDIYSSFTSSIALSLFFFVIIFSSAGLFNLFFQEDNLVPVIRTLALTFVISGIFVTSQSLLRRSLHFKKLAIISMCTYLVSYIFIGVSLAYRGFGVWSLIIASLSQVFLDGLLAYIFTRHSIKLYFNWQVYKPLIKYGSRISIINFMEFIGKSMDTFLVGKFLGSTALGYYNRALMLILLPFQFFMSSISRVLFSAFSKIQGDLKKMSDTYHSSFVILSFILIPTGFGVAIAADEIVLVVLGDKWINSIPVLRVMAFVVTLNFLNHLGAVICDAKGILNVKIILQISYIFFIATMFYLFRGYGITGFASAVLVAEIFRTIAYTFIMYNAFKINLFNLLKTYAFSLTTAFVIAGVIGLIKYLLSDINSIIVLILEISSAAFILYLIVRFSLNKNLNQSLNKYIFANLNISNKYLLLLMPRK